MIKIGIVGYGNLAKGAECAIAQNPDMELVAVFTRRDPSKISVKTAGTTVCAMSDMDRWKNEIDVMLLCGGSATDLPEMTPAIAKEFNVVDSFDNHGQIPQHYAAVNEAAVESDHIALISAGWDPGMFSLNRLYATAVLPDGDNYTFWGKGVSQGHSDAVRRISGVLDCRQYTIPVESALEKVRNGERPVFTTREKHTRYCYVVAAEGADKVAIEHAIKTMPNYFDAYDTTVEFITAEELAKNHAGLPHGGSVIRSGRTGWDLESCQTIEYRLNLDSNPQFTGSILVAYARAVHRMYIRGQRGCKTVFDVAPADIINISKDELLAHYL